MTFLSTTLIKISLILFVTSYIAIAGPVPDVVGNDFSVEGREQTSGGSVSSSKQAAGGDFLLPDGDFLGPSGSDGHGGKAADLKKQTTHNKGVGGPSLAGTRQKQGNTADSAGPFSAFGESPQGGSGQGGSVSGGGDSLVSILSGNGGAGGGERGGLSALNIFIKRNL